ncbi:MAG: hypothetical protein NZO58_03970 [Gemmataceae bacterium]|nr:hypothetical protein [Gemmataceae bacterium]
MDRILVKLAQEAGSAICPLCGTLTRWGRGPRLVDAERSATICRACGKRHAPALVALLDLAHVADKVGRQGRHLLTPPMEALLDLARAAEDYWSSRTFVENRPETVTGQHAKAA